MTKTRKIEEKHPDLRHEDIELRFVWQNAPDRQPGILFDVYRADDAEAFMQGGYPKVKGHGGLVGQVTLWRQQARLQAEAELALLQAKERDAS